MHGHKCSHICNLWGKFLPAGMICTTTDTISIPMGAMYLHARMLCALAHMSFIQMGAINFDMQEYFLHSLIRLLYPWVLYIHMQECSVHSLIRLLFSWVKKHLLLPETFLLLILPKKMFDNNFRECSETNILFRVIFCTPHIFRPIAGKYEFT